jgi:hypothetical protein
MPYLDIWRWPNITTFTNFLVSKTVNDLNNYRLPGKIMNFEKPITRSKPLASAPFC